MASMDGDVLRWPVILMCAPHGVVGAPIGWRARAETRIATRVLPRGDAVSLRIV